MHCNVAAKWHGEIQNTRKIQHKTNPANSQTPGILHEAQRPLQRMRAKQQHQQPKFHNWNVRHNCYSHALIAVDRSRSRRKRSQPKRFAEEKNMKHKRTRMIVVRCFSNQLTIFTDSCLRWLVGYYRRRTACGCRRCWCVDGVVGLLIVQSGIVCVVDGLALTMMMTTMCAAKCLCVTVCACVCVRARCIPSVQCNGVLMICLVSCCVQWNQNNRILTFRGETHNVEPLWFGTMIGSRFDLIWLCLSCGLFDSQWEYSLRPKQFVCCSSLSICRFVTIGTKLSKSVTKSLQNNPTPPISKNPSTFSLRISPHRSPKLTTASVTHSSHKSCFTSTWTSMTHRVHRFFLRFPSFRAISGRRRHYCRLPLVAIRNDDDDYYLFMSVVWHRAFVIQSRWITRQFDEQINCAVAHWSHCTQFNAIEDTIHRMEYFVGGFFSLSLNLHAFQTDRSWSWRCDWCDWCGECLSDRISQKKLFRKSMTKRIAEPPSSPRRRPLSRSNFTAERNLINPSNPKPNRKRKTNWQKELIPRQKPMANQFETNNNWDA